MGCGSSSAAKVAPQSVTVEGNGRPASAGEQGAPPVSPGERGPEVKTHAQSSADGVLGVGPEASSGAQSEDAELKPPSYETVLLQQKQEKKERGREVGQPSQKAVAFEVALSSDGQFTAKKPPPRRLEKLDDASKLTPELLEEKQRIAEENRQKELDKRASVGTRLSKKERLRRQIRDARVSARSKDQSEEIERKQGASEENRLRHQEETKDRLRRKEEHAKKVRARKESGSDAVERESFNGEVEIETDQAYNDRNEDDIWTESQLSSSNQHGGKPTTTRSDDDGFFDDSDGLDYAADRIAEPSCSNEEYM